MEIDTNQGTKANPWKLKSPPGNCEYKIYLDENKDGLKIIVCTVGKTTLHYDARCIDDLHVPRAHAAWMELGGADEQKPAKEVSVEGWGRSADNPVGGWYGLKKGPRGRFGV